MNRVVPFVAFVVVAVVGPIYACGTPEKGAAAPVPTATVSSDVPPPVSPSSTVTSTPVQAAAPSASASADAKLPTVQACFKLQNKLLASAAPAHVAIARRHADCSRDDECMLVPAPGCFSNCGWTALNKRGEEDMRASLNAMEEACKPWNAAGCPKVVPAAECADQHAACVGGRCIMARQR